jgi:hypothetical protein
MKLFVTAGRAGDPSMRFAGYTLVAFMFSSWVFAEPQYIRNLSENGFLTSPVVNPPVVTLTAGQRFLDLVPDSQQELCEIARAYYAEVNEGVNSVRVIGADGQVLLTCGG